MMDLIAPQFLHLVWPQMRQGLERIRERCDEAWWPEDVYASVVAGRNQLWIERAGDEVIGFLLVRFETETYSNTRRLFVWLCWSDSPQDPVARYTEWLRLYARQAGAREVMFRSPRKGWEKVAPAHGWRPTMMEYCLEV